MKTLLIKSDLWQKCVNYAELTLFQKMVRWVTEGKNATVK